MLSAHFYMACVEIKVYFHAPSFFNNNLKIQFRLSVFPEKKKKKSSFSCDPQFYFEGFPQFILLKIICDLHFPPSLMRKFFKNRNKLVTYFRGKYNLLLISVLGMQGRKYQKMGPIKSVLWKFIKVFLWPGVLFFLQCSKDIKRTYFFFTFG